MRQKMKNQENDSALSYIAAALLYPAAIITFAG